MFWAPDLFVLEQIVPEGTGDEETVGGRRHARGGRSRVWTPISETLSIYGKGVGWIHG